MEGKYTGKRYVHSEADIQARVWYNVRKTMMYEQEEEIYTGVDNKRYFIRINNFRINLYKTLPNFEKYDTIDKIKRLELFQNFYLPLELGINEYQEINIVKKTYSKEELKKVIQKQLESEISEEIGDEKQVVNKQINEKEVQGGIEIHLIYEVLENIGIEQRIDEDIE